jgi:integrase
MLTATEERAALIERYVWLDAFERLLNELVVLGPDKDGPLDGLFPSPLVDDDLNVDLGGIALGVAGRNPVDSLDDSHRPQPTRQEAPYFTDDEIPALLAAALPADRPLFRFALMTGMRQGELFGLTWARVNLLQGQAHVREQFSGGETSAPKSQRSQRTVELPPEAVDLLGAVWAKDGKPDGDVLVFPGPNGPRRFKTTLNRFYKAMADAGIPRSGEHLEPPTPALRTFHSLRHSYARIALEHGVELTWLSRQLGHSSAGFTEQRYGHWGAKARKQEMAKFAKKGKKASAFGF